MEFNTLVVRDKNNPAPSLVETRCTWQYSSPNRCPNKATVIVAWSYNLGIGVCRNHANKLRKSATGYRELREIK